MGLIADYGMLVQHQDRLEHIREMEPIPHWKKISLPDRSGSSCRHVLVRGLLEGKSSIFQLDNFDRTWDPIPRQREWRSRNRLTIHLRRK